ncbi:MAG: hypothetical protein OXG15_09555 [Gammaproteobacteria bacterium]|nr:hypothetical protein [Gammaproteobacteria bacterium]
MEISIGVSELATFVHRRGDIDDRSEDPTTAREGIEAQGKYQTRIKLERSSYESEVRVRREFQHESITLHVTGRADGVSIEEELNGSRLLVEEIKTTRKNPNAVPSCDRTVHEAQVRLYAAMLDSRGDVASIATRLTYIHPDSGETHHFDRAEDSKTLDEYFEGTAQDYCNWISDVLTRLERRNEIASSQSFPFETYNKNQLQLARHGFVSLRDKTNLLIEAPTGTGKTMATAFPVVKAMGERELDRVVYSTARTTGQRAAIDAFSALQEQNDRLVQVTVSAKDRVCLTPGAACRPEECDYAKGHFDRVRDATKHLLQNGKVDRTAIDAVAKSKKVCPFELSLDVAEWSDVVICDYNYVFDPLVQLKRLRSRLFNRVGLLVDEAHRLTERVRDMLSCEFDFELIENAVNEARNSSLEPHFKKVQSLLNDVLDTVLPSVGEAVVDEIDNRLIGEVDRLFESDDLRLRIMTDSSAIDDCLYEFLRFRSIAKISEEDPRKFVWLLNRTQSERRIQFRCLLPNAWIKDIVSEFHGSIRFSGTMSPGDLFNEEHGLEGPIKSATLTPDLSRLSVVVVPDVTTYYNERKRTAPDLARLIEDIRGISSGNWLIAFPSFEYMDLVLDHLSVAESTLVQRPRMNLEERDEFLNRLSLDDNQLGFVVMGGVFTESIDIEQASLEGVVVVSPGIPPRSVERDRIATLSDRGYEIAYRRPAMTRVVQAAGRVVRGEKDRGVVVLIDPRFTRSDFARYFPSHWQPETIKAAEIALHVSAFQQQDVI